MWYSDVALLDHWNLYLDQDRRIDVSIKILDLGNLRSHLARRGRVRPSPIMLINQPAHIHIMSTSASLTRDPFPVNASVLHPGRIHLRVFDLRSNTGIHAGLRTCSIRCGCAQRCSQHQSATLILFHRAPPPCFQTEASMCPDQAFIITVLLFCLRRPDPLDV